MRVYLRLTLLVIVGLGSALAVFSQTSNTNDPLIRVLQNKGILTEAEARAITADASPEEQRDRLAVLLRDKGVISATEFDTLHMTATAPEVKTITAEYKTSAPEPVAPKPQPTPAVIAAVAPVTSRVTTERARILARVCSRCFAEFRVTPRTISARSLPQSLHFERS